MKICLKRQGRRWRRRRNDKLQVIKRDGREVQFDVNKIITAIKSANANVADKDKLTELTIEDLKGGIASRANIGQ